MRGYGYAAGGPPFQRVDKIPHFQEQAHDHGALHDLTGMGGYGQRPGVYSVPANPQLMRAGSTGGAHIGMGGGVMLQGGAELYNMGGGQAAGSFETPFLLQRKHSYGMKRGEDGKEQFQAHQQFVGPEGYY